MSAKRPVTDTYHGIAVTDDYRWLQDWNDKQVRAWSESENTYAREWLDRLSNVPALRARISQIMTAKTTSYGNVAYCKGRLFAMKRTLVAMRKVVTPQRDLFARSVDQLAELRGLQLDERDYFRDVYDHLIRISDLIDSYRDLLSGSTDLYLSTVSNRQNEVMKQLAIVGTIFLPLSFITGFFGMNFDWLVNTAIAPTWTFFVLGLGSMLGTCVLLVRFFKRRGWM